VAVCPIGPCQVAVPMYFAGEGRGGSCSGGRLQWRSARGQREARAQRGRPQRREQRRGRRLRPKPIIVGQVCDARRRAATRASCRSRVWGWLRGFRKLAAK